MVTIFIVAIFLVALQLPCCSKAFNPVFTDSAVFERISHFKDVGLPATLNDPVARAMIADGSCRSVGVSNLAPFLMWSSSDSVEKVLQALSNLPDTSEPSHFVLAAEKDLADACRSAGQQGANVTVHASSACISGTYQLERMTNSLSNWYRALCGKNFIRGKKQTQERNTFDLSL